MAASTRATAKAPADAFASSLTTVYGPAEGSESVLLAASSSLADGWLVQSSLPLADALAVNVARIDFSSRLNWGAPALAKPAPDRRLLRVREALGKARAALNARAAYAHFEVALEEVEAVQFHGALLAVLGYISDAGAPYRATLLSCMADRDLGLRTQGDAMHIAAALSDPDREVARSAALALAAAGDAAKRVLRDALRALPPSRREDIERLLKFSGV